MAANAASRYANTKEHSHVCMTWSQRGIASVRLSSSSSGPDVTYFGTNIDIRKMNDSNTAPLTGGTGYLTIVRHIIRTEERQPVTTAVLIAVMCPANIAGNLS